MWDLDDVLDRDVPCASVTACYRELPNGDRVYCDSAARSKNCTGTVPAGEPHYHLHRGWKGPDENADAGRYCRHCVREMNDRCHADEGPLLVRVALTYSDGSVSSLEGDAADDWNRSMQGASFMAGIHGYQGKKLPWHREGGKT